MLQVYTRGIVFPVLSGKRGLPDASISTLYGVGVPVFTQAGLSVASVYTGHGVDFQAGLSVASVYTGHGVEISRRLNCRHCRQGMA